MKGLYRWIPTLLVIALVLAACTVSTPTPPAAEREQGSHSPVASAVELEPDVEYTLSTGKDGQMVFVGVGGEIDGQVNPTLKAQPGDVVKVTLVNGDGILHDLIIDELNVHTGDLNQKGQEASVVFQVNEAGEYIYYCSIPGHRQVGMWGTLRVGEPEKAAAGADIVRGPSDLPGPVGDRAPTTVQVDLVTQEIVGQLDDGATHTYFTFNGKVPGPMIRVLVGDTVELRLKNETSSAFAHSIDLHAVTGPGGGAVYTQTQPGEATVFTFKALNPGVYVYHCATPSVAHHKAKGMYGLIVVEPESGLPPVDREFYVMQGEIYTVQSHGTKGYLDFSHEKTLNETPEWFVFNGAAGALTTEEHALRAKVGETVRIFFGVGGPNFTSSFHAIGEIFDRAYAFGSLTSPPLTDVQTITVPPGGATVVEFRLEVPGRYILVDHALSRLERGLVGYLIAEGEANPEIFREGPASP